MTYCFSIHKGYVYWISPRENGKQISVSFHRMVMSAHLGRPLTKNEEVHHIDGDKKNNFLWNLQLITKSEHRKLHWLTTRIRNIKEYRKLEIREQKRLQRLQERYPIKSQILLKILEEN